MEVTLSVEEEGSGRQDEVVVEVGEDATVKDALAAADINPETVLVERDGQIIPAGSEIDGAEELRVLEVVSGG